MILEVKQTKHVDRTLEEKASVYLRAAEQHTQHVRRHHGGVHHISAPTEDAAKLLDQAIRSFD